MNLYEIRNDLRAAGLQALVVSDPDSIFYLTECRIAPGERLYALVVTEGRMVLVLPEMFKLEASEVSEEKIFFKDTDDFLGIIPTILTEEAVHIVGVDKELKARFLLPMMERMNECAFELGSPVIDENRMIKQAGEITKMQISSELNDSIMGEIVKFLATPEALGITEKQAVKKLAEISEALGAEGFSFDPIICFGAGSAQPHHEPDNESKLEIGSPVIIDIGFLKHGYCSDMTRSFIRTEEGMVTGGKPEYKHIYDIVLGANLAGIEKVAPGVPLAEVDAAARDFIKAAGYDEFFTHRLGHGIGIAVHEFPDVSAASTAVCAPGMIFSIEPGIYHPESGIGVRIEDLVLVTETGYEVLNKYPK